jgi:hypothetical protein
MINTIEDVMKMTKEQIRNLDADQKAQVKKILETEIEKILQRNKK